MRNPSYTEWLRIHYRTSRDFKNPRWLAAVKAVRVLFGVTTYFEPPSERRRILAEYRQEQDDARMADVLALRNRVKEIRNQFSSSGFSYAGAQKAIDERAETQQRMRDRIAKYGADSSTWPAEAWPAAQTEEMSR